MTRKLHISDDLALPMSAETFGLLAVRGGGKTNAARALAEERLREQLTTHMPVIEAAGGGA